MRKSGCLLRVSVAKYTETSVAEISPSSENVITYPRWLDDSDNRYRFMRYVEGLEGRKLHEDAIDVKLSLNS